MVMLRGGGNSLGALPVAGVVGIGVAISSPWSTTPPPASRHRGSESPPDDGANMVEHPALVRADAAGAGLASLDDTRGSAG